MRKLKNYNRQTKLKEESSESLYTSDIFNIISYENWEFVEEKDCVVCIPIFLEVNKVLFRSEYIPTYKYKDKRENYISPIMGMVESGETIEQALKRELEEEAGIVLRENVKIKFEDPLFVSKGNTSKVHIAVLYLSSSNYDMVKVVGDGSIDESRSMTFSIDKHMVSSLKPSDILTSLLIEKLKSL